MSVPLQITRDQAKRFLLARHGLMGADRFIGSQGVMDFIRMVGSIQFDPLDICGRNADLVLQSRVAGYHKQTLWNLLYRERQLVDYFDKELCIFPASDWPLFARIRDDREVYGQRRGDVYSAVEPILAALTEQGPSTTRDLDDGRSVDWFWGSTRLARATLEYLYYAGRVGIAEKRGTTKVYDLIERLLPQELLGATDPFPDWDTLQRYLVMRRIGAVGLLWNRASPVWLGLGDFKTARRNAAFDALLNAGAIRPVHIDGLRDTFYVKTVELEALQSAREESPRCELIAPLDNLIWDRKLIEAIFGFAYSWEVYTPASKRVYGHYVIPILYGDRLVGRLEPVFNKRTKQLTVRNLWPEAGIDLAEAPYRQPLADCLSRFEQFHVESTDGPPQSNNTKKA